MDATHTDIHILYIDGAMVRSTTDRAEAEIMLGRALEIVSGRTDRAYLHTIRLSHQGLRR